MDSKKAPAPLTADELSAVSGGSRRFVEPVLAGSAYKFAPLKYAPVTYESTLSSDATSFKFSPITMKEY